jgi:hypothetical protein
MYACWRRPPVTPDTIEMLATANAKRLVLLFNPVVGGAVLEAP